MENARSNSKMKIKVKASNENVSPLQLEIDDQRGRYLQSMAMSPGFQRYAENIDAGASPLARYFFGGSPISGEAFTSPTTFGASKYSRSTKTSGNNSLGNSSFCSRGRFSLSPLSSVENLDIAPSLMSPPGRYGMPVKTDEEVLVMDDIQVRPTSGAKSGRSSSSSSGRGPSSTSSWSPPFVSNVLKTESGNCRYNSKCQATYGRDKLHPPRLSMMFKSEAQSSRSPMSSGTSRHDPNSRTINHHPAAAESSPRTRTYAAVLTSQPASPIKPEPHHTLANPNAFSDWSPLDDGIEVVLPNGLDKAPIREEVEAYILSTLHGPAKRRLPIFVKFCEGQLSPMIDKRPPQ